MQMIENTGPRPLLPVTGTRGVPTRDCARLLPRVNCWSAGKARSRFAEWERSMAKKGYWVVCYQSVSDESVVPEYAKVAKLALEAGGGRPLVAGKAAKAHEAGKADQRTIVIEFESVEKAIATYESAAYQAALKVLGNAAKRDFRIVEGV